MISYTTLAAMLDTARLSPAVAAAYGPRGSRYGLRFTLDTIRVHLVASRDYTSYVTGRAVAPRGNEIAYRYYLRTAFVRELTRGESA